MKFGSINRFAILDSVMEDNEAIVSEQEEIIKENIRVEPRKVRAAAVGVADSMRTLKARKKGPADKVKSKKVGFNVLRGQVLSDS